MEQTVHPLVMRIATSITVLVLFISATDAQDAPAAPAWQPVDQTVSDYDPQQVSLRRIDPGNAKINEQYTMREPVMRRAHWMPERSLGGEAGLNLPGNYVYRFPGIQAFLDRPQYFVRTGPEKRDFDINKVPWRDGQFKDVASANMVFNLIPALGEPMLPAEVDPWVDARLDGRVRGKLETTLQSLVEGRVRGDSRAAPNPQQDIGHLDIQADARETDGWIDATTYWLGSGVDRPQLPEADAQVVDQADSTE